MQKALPIVALFVAFALLSGCKKEAASTSPSGPNPAASKTNPLSTTRSSAILSTNYPTDGRLILVWGLSGCKHVRLELGGQSLNLNAPDGQIKIKLDLTKDPKADQIKVKIETTQGKVSPNKAVNTVNVGGIPQGSDGKPLKIGSLMTPVVNSSQDITPGQTVLLAKGTGAFPSLTVEVGGA